MARSRITQRRKRSRRSPQLSQSDRRLGVENLESRLLLASDWQNPGNRFDVDDNASTSFEVAPLDANIVVTELNNRQLSLASTGQLPVIGPDDLEPEFYLDVTGDSLVTPLDAVQVINQLNLDFLDAPATSSFSTTNGIATDPAADDSLVNPSPSDVAGSSQGASNGERSAIVWEQFDSANEVWQIHVQRFDASGLKVGDPILVSDSTSRSDRYPDVDVSELGSLAVVWQSRSETGDWDIHARTYTSEGEPIVGVTLVNETTAGRQLNPAVAWQDAATFSVAWQGNGAGDNSGIFTRRMLIDGSADGDETLVNERVVGSQTDPDIDALSDGRVIVVWDGPNGAEGEPDAIYAAVGDDAEQVYAHSSTPDDVDLDAPALSVAADDSALIAYRGGESIWVRDVTSPSLPVPFTALILSRVEPLGEDFNYEIWYLVDGERVSGGVFDIEEREFGTLVVVRADGSSRFQYPPGTTDIVVSIEPENDTDPAPALDFVGGTIPEVDAMFGFTLTTSHPEALGVEFDDEGVFSLSTPTTVSTDDELSGVWFIDNEGDEPAPGLNLPTLPEGWTYEGWVEMPVAETADGFERIQVSTGRFDSANGPDDFSGHSGPEPAPPFPGEDFIVNPPDGLEFPVDLTEVSDGAFTKPGGTFTVLVTVEPEPDNSPEPFVSVLDGEISPRRMIEAGVNQPIFATQPLDLFVFPSVFERGIFGPPEAIRAASDPAISHAADGSVSVVWSRPAVTDGDAAQVVTFTSPPGTPESIEDFPTVTVVGMSTVPGAGSPAVFSVNNDFVTTWQGVAGESDGSVLRGVFARTSES